MYEYLDEVIKRGVLQIYSIFGKYRGGQAFDELNVFQQVKNLYTELQETNLAAFREIAEYYYRSEGFVGEGLHDLWLEDYLSTPSAVIKYAYEPETVRKRDRLIEALIATGGSQPEYDKAMKQWVRMFGWFALDVADAALTESRRKAGVRAVMWQSEHDDKTCEICWGLNGQVFALDDVPPKPHPACRCWTVVVG